jgi:hypothetical protein
MRRARGSLSKEPRPDKKGSWRADKRWEKAPPLERRGSGRVTFVRSPHPSWCLRCHEAAAVVQPRLADTHGGAWRSGSPATVIRAGIDGVADSLIAAQHVLEMLRRTLPNGTSRNRLGRLSNRLTKIIAETHKLHTPGKWAQIGQLSYLLRSGSPHTGCSRLARPSPLPQILLKHFLVARFRFRYAAQPTNRREAFHFASTCRPYFLSLPQDRPGALRQ